MFRHNYNTWTKYVTDNLCNQALCIMTGHFRPTWICRAVQAFSKCPGISWNMLRAWGQFLFHIVSTKINSFFFSYFTASHDGVFTLLTSINNYYNNNFVRFPMGCWNNFFWICELVQVGCTTWHVLLLSTWIATALFSLKYI